MERFGSGLLTQFMPVVFTPPDGKPHPREDYQYDPNVQCTVLVHSRMHIVVSTRVEHVQPGSLIMVDDAETTKWREVNDRADGMRVNLYEDLFSLDRGLSAMDSAEYPFVNKCRDTLGVYRMGLRTSAIIAERSIMDIQDAGLYMPEHPFTAKLTTLAYELNRVHAQPFTRVLAKTHFMVKQTIDEIRFMDSYKAYQSLCEARTALSMVRLLNQLGVLTGEITCAKGFGSPGGEVAVLFRLFHQLEGLYEELSTSRYPWLGDALDHEHSAFHEGLAHLKKAMTVIEVADRGEDPDLKEALHRLKLAMQKISNLKD